MVKPEKSVLKAGNVWERVKNAEKFEKVWESMRKYEKVWESLWMYEKVWESMWKHWV